MKTALIILLVIALIGLFYFAYQNNYSNNSIKYKVDTLIKIIPQKEIKIVEAKPRIKYIRDTLILTPPFIAEVDTVVQRDTIYASFQFPENLMSINFKTARDSIKIPQITVERMNQERNWYEIGAAAVGGIILGIILGK